MKRKRHICAVLLCALVLAGLFTACGSSSNTAAADSAGSGNSSSVPYDHALADEMGWAADTENSERIAGLPRMMHNPTVILISGISSINRRA